MCRAALGAWTEALSPKLKLNYKAMLVVYEQQPQQHILHLVHELCSLPTAAPRPSLSTVMACAADKHTMLMLHVNAAGFTADH